MVISIRFIMSHSTVHPHQLNFFLIVSILFLFFVWPNTHSCIHKYDEHFCVNDAKISSWMSSLFLLLFVFLSLLFLLLLSALFFCVFWTTTATWLPLMLLKSFKMIHWVYDFTSQIDVVRACLRSRTIR